MDAKIRVAQVMDELVPARARLVVGCCMLVVIAVVSATRIQD
jgi:hypothetical protein